MNRHRLGAFALSVLSMGLVAPTAVADEHGEKFVAEMEPVPGGSLRRLNVSPSRMYPVGPQKPDGLKVGIDDPSARYALLPTRVTDKGVFVAITEAADSKSGRLYVDLNGDGDLTNDPLPKNGRDAWVVWDGNAVEAVVNVKVGDQPVKLRFFRYTNKFAKGKKSFEERGNPVFVHREDIREGKVTLGGVTYPILLQEMAARGRYDDLVPVDKEPAVVLFIDRDGNGSYDTAHEKYNLAEPFALGGTTYELDRVTADGSRLVIRRSAKSVAERPLLPTEVGRAAPGFKVKLLGGGEAVFPDDFRGKVVLLDFWSLGCGICMAQKPGLVRTHDRLKGRGVAVVGVCLDPEENRKQADAESKRLGMAWPQAFDGKAHDGEVAKTYGVSALPAALVLDGTTGRVLATVVDVKTAGADKVLNQILAIRDALRPK